ncbi:MAG: endo-1,4-beta-xylanase [Caldilineaceae bacterium]
MESASLPMEIPSLSATLATYFPVGAVLEPWQLESADHVALLTGHFNSITAENVMKPGPIQPSEGNFNWSNADRLADFARENNMFVHGHALVWHQQAAEWMFRGKDNRPLEANAGKPRTGIAAIENAHPRRGRSL